MKYLKTISSLFFLSLFAVLLSLYFGNKTNNLEKNINILEIKIKNVNESIKVNELEYSLLTNNKYLFKLQKIYLTERKNSLQDFNFTKIINISEFNNKEKNSIFKVKINN